MVYYFFDNIINVYNVNTKDKELPMELVQLSEEAPPDPKIEDWIQKK